MIHYRLHISWIIQPWTYPAGKNLHNSTFLDLTFSDFFDLFKDEFGLLNDGRASNSSSTAS